VSPILPPALPDPAYVDQVAAVLAAAVYAGLESSRVPRELPDPDYLRAIERNVTAICAIYGLVRSELGQDGADAAMP
jgi:hypothetical protein